MADNYRQGDHYVIDDRTGRKVWASESRMEWTGAIVDRKDFEPRHPQDFVRARPERAIVKNPRPRPVDTFGGPLDTTLTAAAAAGATSLTVESSVRMEVGDYVSVMLDSGEPFRSLITTVVDSATIIIDPGLPGSAASGNMVYDNTAMSEAVLP